jgi:hypothetical protein
MKLPHFLLLCACVSATSLVLAQVPSRGMRDGRDGQQSLQRELPHDFGRERPERRERFERSEPREQPMSPEERRQLRRDVNDAGREIYRRPDRN